MYKILGVAGFSAIITYALHYTIKKKITHDPEYIKKLPMIVQLQTYYQTIYAKQGIYNYVSLNYPLHLITNCDLLLKLDTSDSLSHPLNRYYSYENTKLLVNKNKDSKLLFYKLYFMLSSKDKLCMDYMDIVCLTLMYIFDINYKSAFQMIEKLDNTFNTNNSILGKILVAKNVHLFNLTGVVLLKEDFKYYIEHMTNKKLVKYVRKSGIHYGMDYSVGTKFKDILPFHPFGFALSGGIYFTLQGQNKCLFQKDIMVEVPIKDYNYVYICDNGFGEMSFKTNEIEFEYPISQIFGSHQ